MTYRGLLQISTSHKRERAIVSEAFGKLSAIFDSRFGAEYVVLRALNEGYT